MQKAGNQPFFVFMVKILAPKVQVLDCFLLFFANLPIKSVDFKSIFGLFSYLCSAHLRTWEPCRIPDKRRNGNPALVGERRAHRLEGTINHIIPSSRFSFGKSYLLYKV